MKTEQITTITLTNDEIKEAISNYVNDRHLCDEVFEPSEVFLDGGKITLVQEFKIE